MDVEVYVWYVVAWKTYVWKTMPALVRPNLAKYCGVQFRAIALVSFGVAGVITFFS